MICLDCNIEMVKIGVLPTKKGIKQRYRCNSCGKTKTSSRYIRGYFVKEIEE